jgi:hypothetical protein
VFQIRIRDFLGLPDPIPYYLYGFVSESFDPYAKKKYEKRRKKKKKKEKKTN